HTARNAKNPTGVTETTPSTMAIQPSQSGSSPERTAANPLAIIKTEAPAASGKKKSLESTLSACAAAGLSLSGTSARAKPMDEKMAPPTPIRTAPPNPHAASAAALVLRIRYPRKKPAKKIKKTTAIAPSAFDACWAFL